MRSQLVNFCRSVLCLNDLKLTQNLYQSIEIILQNSGEELKMVLMNEKNVKLSIKSITLYEL